VVARTAPLAFLVFDTRVAQPGRLPDGWRIKVTRGAPDVTVIHEAPGSVLHLRSQDSSFGLEKALDLDPAQYPFLAWKWKVSRLPSGGDFRHTRTDDQAAQVLVAFGDRRILTYLWDSTAPKGTMQSASSIPFVHIFAFVCRSGGSNLNEWLSETRNVEQDYQAAYGHPPKDKVKGIRLQINTQHTGATAETYFGEVAFRSTP
jgi:hypothetical protein